MHNPALWQRIAAHPLDAPTGTAPFSVKLALAEGWGKEHTKHVIEEYRRFVYLTQISDDQITPSEQIDRAWHMHLTFTRDYWDVFCGQVLGRPLHHEPCAGEEDMPRYRKQYVATKALYQREFGVWPPDDVWGEKPSWWAFALGCVAAVSGAAMLLYVLLVGRTDLAWVLVVAVGLVAAGGICAEVNLPTRSRHTRRKAGKSAGFGGCGGSGCGGGCGGCGG